MKNRRSAVKRIADQLMQAIDEAIDWTLSIW
jgi:hypothetical protein